MKLIKLSLIALSLPFMVVSCDDKKEAEDKDDTSDNAPTTIIEKEVVEPSPEPTPEKDKTKFNLDTENGTVGFENDKVDVDLNLPSEEDDKQ